MGSETIAVGNKPNTTLTLDEKDKILGILKTAIESFFKSLIISLRKWSGCLKCSKTSKHIIINDPYQSKDLSILKHSVPNYIKESPHLMSKIIKIDQQAVDSPSKGNFEIYLKKKL